MPVFDPFGPFKAIALQTAQHRIHKLHIFMQSGIAGQVDRAVDRTVIGCVHKEQLCNAKAHDVGQAGGNPVLWRLIARRQNRINFAHMAQCGAQQMAQVIAVE